MSRENVELVRSILEPFAGGNIAAIDWSGEEVREAVGASYADDVELQTLATGVGSGMDSVYRGWDGLIRYLREWLEPFSEYHVEWLDFIDDGDRVLVPSRQWGIGRASGARVELEVTHLYAVRDGQIARLHQFDTLEEAREAAGPAVEAQPDGIATTPRTKLRRKPKRGSHEREVINAILDEALVSHLGVVDDAGHPIVTPTLHARRGSHVYVHGSAANRTLRESGRSQVCLTTTLLDGLVLARAAMHHSANYRSVMLFGRVEPIDADDEKVRALEAFTDKLVPGRWADVRPPTAKELRATSILRVPIEEASAKIRTGQPIDDAEDHGLPVWAGTIGLRMVADEPTPDPQLAPGVDLPAYLDELVRSWRNAGPR